MTLIEAQRQYQDALEAHRANPDCDDTWQQLVQARTERDRAWLEFTCGTGTVVA